MGQPADVRSEWDDAAAPGTCEACEAAGAYGAPSFRTERVRMRGAAVLRVHGRVDLHSVTKFIGQLRRALLESRDAVVLNLAGCTFVASTGWGAILATAAAAARLDRRFVLCCVPPAVAEGMALLNLRRPVPVAGSEEEALQS